MLAKRAAATLRPVVAAGLKARRAAAAAVNRGIALYVVSPVNELGEFSVERFVPLEHLGR